MKTLGPLLALALIGGWAWTVRAESHPVQSAASVPAAATTTAVRNEAAAPAAGAGSTGNKDTKGDHDGATQTAATRVKPTQGSQASSGQQQPAAKTPKQIVAEARQAVLKQQAAQVQQDAKARDDAVSNETMANASAAAGPGHAVSPPGTGGGSELQALQISMPQSLDSISSRLSMLQFLAFCTLALALAAIALAVWTNARIRALAANGPGGLGKRQETLVGKSAPPSPMGGAADPGAIAAVAAAITRMDGRFESLAIKVDSATQSAEKSTAMTVQEVASIRRTIEALTFTHEKPVETPPPPPADRDPYEGNLVPSESPAGSWVNSVLPSPDTQAGTSLYPEDRHLIDRLISEFNALIGGALSSEAKAAFSRSFDLAHVVADESGKGTMAGAVPLLLPSATEQYLSVVRLPRSDRRFALIPSLEAGTNWRMFLVNNGGVLARAYFEKFFALSQGANLSIEKTAIVEFDSSSQTYRLESPGALFGLR